MSCSFLRLRRHCRVHGYDGLTVRFRLRQVLWSTLASLWLTATGHASTIDQAAFDSSLLSRPFVYSVYLPSGYEEQPAQHYPVLYLLHGASGNEQSWARMGDVQATLDELIDSGRVPPMLVIMPADPNFWWADSHLESVRTAVITELLPHVEDTYRISAARDARLIAGYSAGGFGAANIVMSRPDLFAAAALLSPAVYHPVPPASSSATRSPVFQTAGEFDPERWRALNWVSFFDDYLALGPTVPLYINSGDHDRFDIAYHAAAMFQALREHQAEHVELRIFDGDHDFAAWGGSLGDALIYLSGYLAL